jgi:hypothetical protein
MLMGFLHAQRFVYDVKCMMIHSVMLFLSAFRPRGVPGPTSKLSLRVPAQMGRRETEHKGEQ